MKTGYRTTMTILRDAALIMALSAVLAFGVNAARDKRLALVARENYQILVPCPETGEDVEGVAVNDPRLSDPQSLLVDARPASDEARWSPDKAIPMPYDYLEPTPPEVIANLLHAKARGIFVFGDGGDPDSGEQLARELAGKGVRHVFYVVGGAEALKAAREGGRP
jgi:hypothetical protein